MKIDRIHHVAYRCKDARQTVEFYTKMLNMDFVLAIAEDRVPSNCPPNPKWGATRTRPCGCSTSPSR